MRFYLGATATLPLFPPRSQAARGGMCVCVRGQRGVRACKTCQGCVKCVLVGASVCWAGSVCVCLWGFLPLSDAQMSFLITQMLLIYNQIFLLLLAWQFSQTTVLTCSCLCFHFICMIISFPIKQPRFSSKESSSIHVFSPREMPLKQAVCPVLLTPTSINIIFFLQIHQAEVKLDFIASTVEL